MTPVRERGKLVRLALERYIANTAHLAGDVEEQILAISEWLISREKPNYGPTRSASQQHVRLLIKPLPLGKEARSSPLGVFLFGDR